MMILESDGINAANNWRDQIAGKIAENYQDIDRIANGYDPNMLPGIQGLPDLYDELERTGIEVEVEKTVGSSYIFDVDGVITDIEERRVTKEEMFDELIKRLEVSPISFNTGRSLEWVVANVLNPLKNRVASNKQNPLMLSNLFITAESGGVWATVDRKGNVEKHIDEDLELPHDLAGEAQSLLDNKYGYAVANMDPKTTMLSAEKNLGFDQTEFDDVKQKIKADLEALVAVYGLNDQFVVDATTIAVDIRSRASGKPVGIRKFLQWLESKKVEAKTFYTYGDSESDIEMAEELERQGQNVVHKHYGNKLTPEQRTRHSKVEIIEPIKRFSDAVLHDLQQSEI